MKLIWKVTSGGKLALHSVDEDGDTEHILGTVWEENGTWIADDGRGLSTVHRTEEQAKSAIEGRASKWLETEPQAMGGAPPPKGKRTRKPRADKGKPRKLKAESPKLATTDDPVAAAQAYRMERDKLRREMATLESRLDELTSALDQTVASVVDALDRVLGEQ